MITVRFPNGHAVRYNAANYVTRSTEYSDLYTKKDGVWIAQIPNTCIIESLPACRVYNALNEDALAELTKEVRLLRRKIVLKTKRKS